MRAGPAVARVNSLRREDGDVTLRQRSARLTMGLDYLITRAVGAAVACRTAMFAQHEQSVGDGNDIVLRERTIAVRLTLER